MKIIVVVDANIILSALMGGKARSIFSKGEFSFITSEFTINEVIKYSDLISKRSGESRVEVLRAILLLPIKVYNSDYYPQEIKLATKIMKEIDPKDVDVLALALKLNAFLWSEDKHFGQIKDQIKLIKTKDLI